MLDPRGQYTRYVMQTSAQTPPLLNLTFGASLGHSSMSMSPREVFMMTCVFHSCAKRLQAVSALLSAVMDVWIRPAQRCCVVKESVLPILR